MRRWLSGKVGGFCVMLLIASLVVGGLGGVTALVLRLEEEQHRTLEQMERSQAETAHVRAQRLALWRLDEFVYEVLAVEGTRPYHDYAALIAAVPVNAKKAEDNKALTVLELLLTRPEDAPAWMCHSYLVALEADWSVPNALRDDLVRHLNVARRVEKQAKKAPMDDPVLDALNRSEMVREFLNEVRQQDIQAQVPANPQVVPNATQAPLFNFNRNDASRGGRTDNNSLLRQPPGNTQLQQRMNVDPDTMARMARGQAEKGAAPYASQVPPAPPVQDGSRSREDRQPVVILGGTTPLWLRGEGEERLVLARLVQIGRKPACQVTVLDWPLLERALREKVHDLLPEARLLPDPVRAATEENQERAMTAMPLLLDPGPVPIPLRAWQGSSLRVSLGLAWAAAVVALLAVALGGWALLDLSERRIRFVSAVTHELRTPLTSLRLYLDMLTSGIVTDEKRKEEYLHTLNAETDRLNRLVGNVLDFSRLENQRPKLCLGYVTVADLLYQIRSTWEGRSQDAGKELTIDDKTDPEYLLNTDEQLVQQILGNLIDNACKYSRGADDPRLWVRASAEGTTLFLQVEDRGPGVAAREQRTIFHAFRRGRDADVTAGGVGLGLALAQRWASLLGGSITLQPAGACGGACFQVALPGLTRVADAE